MVDPIAESYKKQVLNEAKSMKKMKVTSSAEIDVEASEGKYTDRCTIYCSFLDGYERNEPDCLLFDDGVDDYMRCKACVKMVPAAVKYTKGMKTTEKAAKVTVPIFAEIETEDGKNTSRCLCKYKKDVGESYDVCAVFDEKVKDERCKSCLKMFPVSK